MVQLNFVYKKEELLETYEAACKIYRISFNPNDFFKNYPSEDINPTSWIERWKINEKDIIDDIEKVYRPFPEGKISTGLFPNRDIIWKFPFRHSFTFCPPFDPGEVRKAMIVLFSSQQISKILIHELFHVNDMLYREVGLVNSQKHEWIEGQAQKIAKKYFNDYSENN